MSSAEYSIHLTGVNRLSACTERGVVSAVVEVLQLAPYFNRTGMVELYLLAPVSASSKLLQGWSSPPSQQLQRFLIARSYACCAHTSMFYTKCQEVTPMGFQFH